MLLRCNVYSRSMHHEHARAIGKVHQVKCHVCDDTIHSIGFERAGAFFLCMQSSAYASCLPAFQWSQTEVDEATVKEIRLRHLYREQVTQSVSHPRRGIKKSRPSWSTHLISSSMAYGESSPSTLVFLSFSVLKKEVNNR